MTEQSKHCPACGMPMKVEGGKSKKVGRVKYICTDEIHCGHQEREETGYEKAIRFGIRDKFYNILKPHIEQ